MASVKLVLDTRVARKDGTFPLKLRVSHKGSFQIGLGVSLPAEQWDGGAVVLPKEQAAKARQLNEYIQGRLGYAQNTLRRLALLGELPALSDQALKAQLDPNAKPVESQPDTPLFADHFRRFMERRAGRPNGVYHDTYKKITKYYDPAALTFEQMTIGWMKDLEGRLREEGLAVNTIAKHFSNLRALYNDAIDYGIVSLASYPFRRFRIRQEPTAKRALTINQLRQLRDYPCEAHQEKYRDLFMLSFYLGGINLIDLFRLEAITEGRIEYVRSKTGVRVSLAVQPEAMAIIERYRGTGRLLAMADAYASHTDFLHRMDQELKKIGPWEWVANAARDPRRVKRNKKRITPLFPQLSSYWARHTCATLMAELDIPDATIDRVLAHADNTLAAIYIKRNQQKVDQAIRRLIDWVNE